MRWYFTVTSPNNSNSKRLAKFGVIATIGCEYCCNILIINSFITMFQLITEIYVDICLYWFDCRHLDC